MTVSPVRALCAALILLALTACTRPLTHDSNVGALRPVRLIGEQIEPVSEIDFGELELLDGADAADRFGPPGPPGPGTLGLQPVAGAVEFDGWVLRLDADSASIDLLGPLVGAELAGAERPSERGVETPWGFTTPSEQVVRLESPWGVSADEVQGILLGVHPRETGRFRGALEILRGDSVLGRIPLHGEVVLPE